MRTTRIAGAGRRGSVTALPLTTCHGTRYADRMPLRRLQDSAQPGAAWSLSVGAPNRMDLFDLISASA